jgi:hypothetical protein
MQIAQRGTSVASITTSGYTFTVNSSGIVYYADPNSIKQVDSSEEYSSIIEYMEMYGINYVRGSRYTSMELSSYDREVLNNSLFKDKIKVNEIKSTAIEDDFKQISYVSSTGLSKDKMKDKIVSSNKSYTCIYCEMEFDNSDILKRHEHICKDKAFVRSSGKDLNCERCGRNTHSSLNCRARTDIYGYDI